MKEGGGGQGQRETESRERSKEKRKNVLNHLKFTVVQLYLANGE